jgi:hypothetical protein
MFEPVVASYAGANKTPTPPASVQVPRPIRASSISRQPHGKARPTCPSGWVIFHLRISNYIAGRGGMRASLAGLLSVVDEADTPHLNAGALHRWFLEAAWLPTALLPSQGVRWEPLDDSSARATLGDAGMTLSMDVHFGDDGSIVRVEANRMRDANGAGVPTPFVGRVHDYTRVDGMMIPLSGEVEWILPEGVWTFWKARITSVAYDYAR